MHTSTWRKYGIEIDVERLQALARGRPCRMLPIAPLLAEQDWRRPESGYDPERVARADLSVPILVDSDHRLIDGRHRLLGLEEMGVANCLAVVLTDPEIWSARV